MMNSDQVNYLVWRYLSESGFEHAAFNLKSEMRNAEALDRAWATRVPTGHLVDSLQRALMFEECMAQVDESGVQRDPADVQPTSLIPGEAAGETPKQLELNGAGKRKADQVDRATEKRRRTPPPSKGPAGLVTGNGSLDSPMPDVSPKAAPRDAIRTISDITYLEGHTSGSDQVHWHPVQHNTLASSSLDGTARIWTLATRPSEAASSVVLSCLPSRTPDKSVTSLSWNTSGTLIATGSFDGVVRIWNLQGVKQHRDLSFHNGPIFALKWSRRGDFILSACADGHIGVWNTATGSLQQKWDLKSPVMDIEWISDALFLSACRDGTLKMWQLSRDAQVKHFVGHRKEISVLKWNSNINLGATGGEDTELKIWRADSEKPTQVLLRHRKQIHAIEWAPRNQGDYRILASASRDGQVCVWDAVRGELLHTFAHDRPIFTVAFSYNNQLACAGEQGEVTLWDVEKGKMLANNKNRLGLIYNIKFSLTGDRLAAATATNKIMVLGLDSLSAA